MCFGMKPIIETRLTSLICLRIYSTFVLVGFSTINQGCTKCGILASWQQENGKRMRKWREIPSLLKNCLILSQNVKYGTFVVSVIKNGDMHFEETILGQIRCEEAPQVVPACL